MPTLESLLGRTLVLIAHPDDEALGCGALLQRVREPVVCFATDGAPLAAKWWQPYGSRAPSPRCSLWRAALLPKQFSPWPTKAAIPIMTLAACSLPLWAVS